MATITGSDLLARSLGAQGVDTFFFLMGGPMLETESALLALGRELAEIEYLWRVPHRISGEKLKSVVAGFAKSFA